jgi:protein-glutamine gamma-glutamyltransferase
MNQFSGARYVAYSRQMGNRLDLSKGRPTEDLVDDKQLSSYLTVPRSLSPRVAELARKITDGKPGPLSKAMAIVEWLQKTHRYTTDLKRDLNVPDPLEDFLFHQDAGHCEYFASATSVLLRLAGIPSRYVNGFLGGEWNALGKYLSIRDNRAHSWAEAYVGAGGWVKIDATPAAGAGWQMSGLKQVVDSIEYFWSRWVIDYDVSRQIDIARKIGQGMGAARGPVDLGGLKRGLRLLGFALAAGLLAGVLYRRLRKRPQNGGRPVRSLRGRRNDPRIYKLYDLVLSRLGKRGWQRGPGETPREFARRVAAAQVPGATTLVDLSEQYAAARFGEREIPDEVVARLERAAADLYQAAASPGSSPTAPTAPSPPSPSP